MSDKPVVQYLGNPTFYYTFDDSGNEYQYARVYALDHPRLGMTDVRTSVLVSEAGDEGFETLNTIYKQYKGAE